MRRRRTSKRWLVAVGLEPPALPRQPTWIDSGEEDPFIPGIDAFSAALEEAGAPLTMAFYADALEGYSAQ